LVEFHFFGRLIVSAKKRFPLSIHNITATIPHPLKNPMKLRFWPMNHRIFLMNETTKTAKPAKNRTKKTVD
jgi:hypothetical protein